MSEKPAEQTTVDPRLLNRRIILDGISLINRMIRAEEPWCESDVRDWVRRAREIIRSHELLDGTLCPLKQRDP